MHITNRQRGMTMWGLMFVLGVLAFVVFLVLNLLPPYMEDLKVRNALDGLAKENNIATMSKAEMVGLLEKRFDIDSVTNVKPSKSLFLESRGKMKVIRVRYEAVVPLAYNISALLEFDHEREVRSVE